MESIHVCTEESLNTFSPIAKAITLVRLTLGRPRETGGHENYVLAVRTFYIYIQYIQGYLSGCGWLEIPEVSQVEKGVAS